MAYTTIDKPSDYFETILFTGNGSNGHAISGLDFQPDWVWLKNRNTTNTHEVFDSVRGATKTLYPDTSDAEYVNATGSLTSFNSDGFTVGSGDGANKSGSGIASWNWKAGTSFTNDASATGVGSIDSSGSVNTDAGFAIISWVGTGVDATIAHGLGSAPKIVFVKNRSTTDKWRSSFTALDGSYDYMHLNTTEGVSDEPVSAPTSSVFSVYSHAQANGNGNSMIAYCFAEKQGYSKFGSYTGNGNADGPFTYLGFKPAFIMGKRTDNTGPWWMLDNKRDGYNVTNRYLLADDSRAEGTDVEYNTDILSNGFKARYNNGNFNASGGSYIYMAFAENPFTSSAGTPVTAR